MFWFDYRFESNPFSSYRMCLSARFPCGISCFLTDASAINHHLFLMNYIQLFYYIVIHVAMKGEYYMLSMTEQSLAPVLFPCFSHGFWTICGHCMYFYASSQLSVDRICKTTVHLTHTSHSGTAWLCTQGSMSNFSVFSHTKTDAVGSRFAMLTLFWRGRGSVCGGGLLCHPDLLPSMQFDIHSSSTWKQHFSEIMSNSVIFRIKK